MSEKGNSGTLRPEPLPACVVMTDRPADAALAALLRTRTGDVEIVARPSDAQLLKAAGELRHAAGWLSVMPARTAALSLCELVAEYVSDPCWKREEALYLSKEAFAAAADDLGPARGRGRRLQQLVEDLLRGDEIDQRLDAIERYRLL
jgi:hypothetical protein